MSKQKCVENAKQSLLFFMLYDGIKANDSMKMATMVNVGKQVYRNMHINMNC